ncbi:hypothetical protein ACKWRH_34225 [Bradyrhizobium sp. Pa8]|uniref:hypothetical protein n=1 Tax=Bradyrhizobium sp. Pa8 TaxID=3386552 RepID=UPI00403F3460
MNDKTEHDLDSGMASRSDGSLISMPLLANCSGWRKPRAHDRMQDLTESLTRVGRSPSRSHIFILVQGFGEQGHTLRHLSMQPPYSSTDVATAIGISLDTFYRTRRLRHERDGLPSPISERGPLKWERTGFDAWLTRNHPMRPKSIANDAFVPPPPGNDDEHRERLRKAYGQSDA